MEYPRGWQPIPYAERCERRRIEFGFALERAVDACRARAEVVALVAFGSYARNEVSPWSDLDLLVVTDGESTAAVTALYAAGTLGDVLGLSSRDRVERLERTPFGSAIAREGIEVYARPAR